MSKSSTRATPKNTNIDSKNDSQSTTTTNNESTLTTTTKPTKSQSTKSTHDDEQPQQQESVIMKILQFIFVVLLIIGGMIYLNPLRITPIHFQPQSLPIVPIDYNLDYAESIFRSLRRLKGPESIAIHPTNGYLYSGTQDGKIIRATLNKPYSSSPETLGVIGDPNAALPLPCGTYTTEPICGRPLGMKFHQLRNDGNKHDILFFADAYLGIAQYNTNTHGLTMLVQPNFIATGGEKYDNVMFNDVVYDQIDHVLYFSISSTKFRLNDMFFELLELAPNGILCKYDFDTKKVTVVKKDIAFANGIIIHPTKRILFISELTRIRILSINIDSKSKSYGQSTIFAENLPILPDNLAIIGNDELWVAGVSIRIGGITNTNDININEFPTYTTGIPLIDQFSLFDYLATRPKYRYFLGKAIPAQFTSTFTAATKGGITRLDLNSGKVLSLMVASKSHINSSTEGIGRSIASITPHNDPTLPENQIYIYLGGFRPEVTSIGRLIWDLKAKTAIPSLHATTLESRRETYRQELKENGKHDIILDYV